MQQYYILMIVLLHTGYNIISLKKIIVADKSACGCLMVHGASISEWEIYLYKEK